PEDPRGAHQHAHQVAGRVVIEPRGPAEAVAQRGRQQPGARGGADQREARQLDAHGLRRRALPDQDAQAEVLHRRIQHLLHDGRQAVDLVDEEHVAGLDVREQPGQVGAPLQHRAARGAELRAHLARHDARQRGLPEPGRAVEEQVVERLAPLARRGDEDREVLAQLLLADHLVEGPRAEALLEAALLAERLPRDLAARRGRGAHRESLGGAGRTRASIGASSPRSAITSSTMRSAWLRGTWRFTRAESSCARASWEPAPAGSAGTAALPKRSKARSRSSITMRCASLAPTPVTLWSAATLPVRIAASTCAASRPGRTVSASRGPTRLACSSSSNTSRSSSVAKPNSWSAFSRRWVWVRSATRLPGSGSRVKVESGICTS